MSGETDLGPFSLPMCPPARVPVRKHAPPKPTVATVANLALC